MDSAVTPQRPFLTARWEHLLFFNFHCPAELLQPLVPSGTILDSWRGDVLLSMVGFMFRDTLVRGIGIPCHRTFEEVNLRFYVRRELPDGGSRRGVVFIKELVPRRAIAAAARRLYHEPYEAVPMSNANDLESGRTGMIAYFWGYRRQPFGVRATVVGEPTVAPVDSAAEFITEHYWGYTRQRDGSTLEYQVEHPRWRLWTPTESFMDGAYDQLYGPAFGGVLREAPASVLAAEGSPVAVYPGRPISG